MENPNNRMMAAGRLEGRPELSHEVMNEPFYTATLLVKRLSGTAAFPNREKAAAFSASLKAKRVAKADEIGEVVACE